MRGRNGPEPWPVEGYYIKEGVFKTIMKIITFAVLIWLYNTLSYAEDIPAPKDLWKALIAENIGYADRDIKMRATACVVRNRLAGGLNMGLVGLYRKDLPEFIEENCNFLKATTGRDYRQISREIVEEVFNNNIDCVNGATHYEDIFKYPVPYWAPDMIEVHRIGGVVFYKRR